MALNPLIAGFELEPFQSFFIWLVIVGYWLFLAVAAVAAGWILFQTFLAIKHPVAKNGFARRKVVLIVWSIAIVSIAGVAGVDYISKKRGLSYNQSLSVAYARTYNHPVILPKTLDYKLAFEQHRAELQLYGPEGASLAFSLVQVPLTDIGRKYFDTEKGYCDFEHMRENRSGPERDEEETCELHDGAGEFKVYKTPDGKYYAVYKNIVSKVKASPDDIMKVVADLKVTDSNELVSAFESDRFSGSYPAVLDRWRNEGRF